MSKISDLKVTSQIFSQLLGVSRRTVESWKREGLPHSKKGIPFVEGFQWWRAERFKELDELRAARTRREVAKAHIAELDAKEREKSLIPRSEAVHWLSTIVSEAKQGFLNLPRRVAETLMGRDAKEVESILRFEIHDVLWRLSGKKKPEAPLELLPWDKGTFEIIVGKDGKRKKVLKRKAT
jgi:phage terminase Nu1 subunit (DNA packaging protein)